MKILGLRVGEKGLKVGTTMTLDMDDDMTTAQARAIQRLVLTGELPRRY